MTLRWDLDTNVEVLRSSCIYFVTAVILKIFNSFSKKKNQTWNFRMIQQLYFWAHAQKKREQGRDQMFVDVHSSIVHKSRKAETTHVPLSARMEGSTKCGRGSNGILLSLRKTGNLDTVCNMAEP